MLLSEKGKTREHVCKCVQCFTIVKAKKKKKTQPRPKSLNNLSNPLHSFVSVEKNMRERALGWRHSSGVSGEMAAAGRRKKKGKGESEALHPNSKHIRHAPV